MRSEELVADAYRPVHRECPVQSAEHRVPASADTAAVLSGSVLRGSFSAVSAAALWVNFDGHQTVTVTMDHLPGTVLTPVDGRRS